MEIAGRAAGRAGVARWASSEVYFWLTFLKNPFLMPLGIFLVLESLRLKCCKNYVLIFPLLHTVVKYEYE